MNGPEILRIVDAIHRDKSIDPEIIFEGIEQAILSAARKHFSEEEELVCPDCHKGFETWTGAKGSASTEKDYEKRASGAVLRRKKEAKPES